MTLFIQLNTLYMYACAYPHSTHIGAHTHTLMLPAHQAEHHSECVGRPL